MIANLGKIISILGIFITVTGVFEIYASIKPESKTFFASPDERPSTEVRLNEGMARKGLFFIISGFLIQIISMVF